MKRLAIGSLALAYIVIQGISLANAQDSCEKIASRTPAFYYCDEIRDLQGAKTQTDRTKAAANLALFFATKEQVLPAALGYSVLDAMFLNAQTTRTDKQTGAPASANGTTSLASLPGATDLISIAVGVGAITQTTSGTTTTLATNIGQLITAMNGSAFDYSLKGIPVLQNIDATVSIGSAPGSTTSVPVVGTSNGSASVGNATVGATSTSISGATVRYQLFNKFDPQSPQFKAAFQNSQLLSKDNLEKTKATVAITANKLIVHFTDAASDDTALQTAVDSFTSAPDTVHLVTLFNAYFFQIRQKAMSDDQFKTDLGAFAAAMNSDLNLYRQIVQSAKGIPALTLEYTYSNIPSQPVTNNVRVIYGYQNSTGMMFTANAAATFYGSLPAGAQISHFRDFQGALQWDLPIAPSALRNALDLSAAGYGQYQQSPSLLTVSASDLPSGFPPGAPVYVAGTKGWLGVAQVKLTVRGPTGVQIVPISWKWASRTDLFYKADNSFQFGLSYDISSLSQMFGIH